MDDWLKKNPDAEEALIELEKYIAGNANVIVIEVGDEYDAFVIFETLNDRGLELAVADLVKNYLFSLAGERLEAFKKAWGEITLLIGSENLTPFLRHLWLSEYQFVRERDVYRDLRQKVKTKTVARQFVERLRKAADLYAALLNPEAPYWTDVPDDARDHLKALRLFRAAQFRPLALAVMEGGTEEQVAQVLCAVSVLTFRYTIRVRIQRQSAGANLFGCRYGGPQNREAERQSRLRVGESRIYRERPIRRITSRRRPLEKPNWRDTSWSSSTIRWKRMVRLVPRKTRFH